MSIDFTPLLTREVSLYEFSQTLTKNTLRNASNASIDAIMALLEDVTDEEINFVPVDPDAHDADAVEGEETIGWSLGHLILHVTASAEEGAAISSLLARGVPVEQRLRFEHDWKTHCRSKIECLHRLEESRRIRNAYLDTWPALPLLDTFQTFPEDHRWHQQINAQSGFILGLSHEVGHMEQIRAVKQQARAASTTETA
jgi:hypothetical protein